MAIDPVCKMEVDPQKAAAKAEHRGRLIISVPTDATRSSAPTPKSIPARKTVVSMRTDMGISASNVRPQTAFLQQLFYGRHYLI
jgi:hypothetical protein